MTRLFRRRTINNSSPKETTIEPPSFSLIDYKEGQPVQKTKATLAECLTCIDSPAMTWVQVEGLGDLAAITEIGKAFHIHPLAVEDILHITQRPKLDVYDNQIFIVMRLLSYAENETVLKDEQFSLVFGPNYLISFQEKKSDFFQGVIERLLQGHARLCKQGSDYLAYVLLDTVVDSYLQILEQVDTHLDKLEEEVDRASIAKVPQRIQYAKRDMIVLRKTIWPLRDVVNRFIHLETPLVCSTTQVYLQDIHDHIVQTIDMVEGFRDLVAGMFDVYLSNINIRTNEIMKLLTVVSTIFVPLTFVTSLYGMNFEHMPELHVWWAYPAVLLGMLTIACSMLLFFHRKKWI